MSLKILTGDEKCQKDYNKKFKDTHPNYWRDYMRERRKRIIEEKIQQAKEILYGEHDE